MEKTLWTQSSSREDLEVMVLTHSSISTSIMGAFQEEDSMEEASNSILTKSSLVYLYYAKDLFIMGMYASVK